MSVGITKFEVTCRLHKFLYSATIEAFDLSNHNYGLP